MIKQDCFCLDDKYYDVSVQELTITGEKISNDKSGRTKSNLSMWLKYDGIFVNYTVTIGKRTGKDKEFFKLFDRLLFDKDKTVANKKNQGGIHTVKFPYGNVMHTFQAYCSGTSINIKKFNGQSEWDKYGTISVNFIAISPTNKSPIR